MITTEQKYMESSINAGTVKAGWDEYFPNIPYSLPEAVKIFHKPENQDFAVHLQKKRLARQYKDNPRSEQFTRFMTCSIEKFEEYLGEYLYAAS